MAHSRMRTNCVAPWQPGYCQTTAYFAAKGDCSTDIVGSMEGVASADECARRCTECESCAYVSFSRRDRSCDWYSACPRRRPPVVGGKQTDHCTLGVRTPSRGLLSFCQHGGFANQLYELLTAAQVASANQLTLLLRPVIHPLQAEWGWGGCTAGDDAVDDLLDQCTAPGWAGGSHVQWRHVIDRHALPCRTASSDHGALFPTRTLRFGFFSNNCDSSFVARNTSRTLWPGCGEAMLRRTPQQRLHPRCLSQLIEAGGHRQHFAFGSMFDVLRPWRSLHDGELFASHVRFTEAVTGVAAQLVRRLRRRSPDGFWCAHVRVGRRMDNGHIGGFHDELYRRHTAPAVREWARTTARSVGFVATDNVRALQRELPELCANRTCVHDAELARLAGCSIGPPSTHEPCQVVHLAATCLVCAHAAQLFFSGGSTFSRLILDLHLWSPMVDRDASFRNAGRSVTLAGYASSMPFGGADELRRALRKQGARMRFGRTAGYDDRQ